MNLTKNAKVTELEDNFWQNLVSLASDLHRINDPLFFLKKPDPSKETYWKHRENLSMKPLDFERGGARSAEELKNALAGLWSAEGNLALTVLADGIGEIAESAHVSEEQSSEVSPFIYVMF
jgi:heme oxygenase